LKQRNAGVSPAGPAASRRRALALNDRLRAGLL
jgi:hypothetical protein